LFATDQILFHLQLLFGPQFCQPLDSAAKSGRTAPPAPPRATTKRNLIVMKNSDSG